MKGTTFFKLYDYLEGVFECENCIEIDLAQYTAGMNLYVCKNAHKRFMFITF